MDRVTNLFSQLSGPSCTVDGAASGMTNPLTNFVNHLLGLQPGTKPCSLQDSIKRVDKALNKLNKMSETMSLTPEEKFMAKRLEESREQMEHAWYESQKTAESRKAQKQMEKAWQESHKTTIKKLKSVKQKILDLMKKYDIDKNEQVSLEPPESWVGGDWVGTVEFGLYILDEMINGKISVDELFLIDFIEDIMSYQLSFSPEDFGTPGDPAYLQYVNDVKYINKQLADMKTIILSIGLKTRL